MLSITPITDVLFPASGGVKCYTTMDSSVLQDLRTLIRRANVINLSCESMTNSTYGISHDGFALKDFI